MHVLVLDAHRRPLAPCHPARARKLLTKGRAAIFRHAPFTILLTDRTLEASTVPPHRLKIDPGSKTTGLAILHEGTGTVVWAAELHHRGEHIHRALLRRRALRHHRRYRKTRSRAPRFANRRRPEGWLPPSLASRVANVRTWVERLRRGAPITALSLERTKFDTQALENPEIRGVEYQHGTLFGYEVWESLLAKWGHRCAYCGAQDVPLEKDHIVPRSRGASDRVSNLTVACRPCNQEKGNRTAAEFGHPEVEARAKAPLKDAAALNATRWALSHALAATGLPLETGTGGRTRFNRVRLGLPKAHWIDAVCVGPSTPEHLWITPGAPWTIRAAGHGTRQRCGTDRYGVPIRHAPRGTRIRGVQSGDLVLAEVPCGKHRGHHVGHVAVRASGWFRVGQADGISWRHCRVLQRADGYRYSRGTKGCGRSSPRLKAGASAAA